MVNLGTFARRRRRDSYKISVAAGSTPVLGVFRSNKYSYAYVRQDGRVVCAISNLGKSVPAEIKAHNNNETAKWIGNQLVEKLKDHKIGKIVFNKSGYRFHGRIKTIVDTIREGGIQC